MFYLLTELKFYTGLMIVIIFVLIFIYEGINGFHDTANAIVAVVYTKSLQEKYAVILSGMFNFLGVITGGLSVSYTIIHLFPNNLFVSFSSSHNLIMILSILCSGIIWNIGTWYLGFPSSSSHTLIGAIIGSCLTNALIKNVPICEALNVPKLIEIFLSLIISPLIGLLLSGTTVFFIRKFFRTDKKNECIYLNGLQKKTKRNEHPPFLTRIILIFSSICLSFSHGTNDGQKGIGLIMLILMGFFPARFSININASSHSIKQTKYAIDSLQEYYLKYYFYFEDKNYHSLYLNREHKRKIFVKSYCYDKEKYKNSFYIKKLKRNNFIKKNLYSKISCSLRYIDDISILLKDLNNYSKLNIKDRLYIRNALNYISNTIDELLKFHKMSIYEKHFLKNIQKNLLYTIEYAPFWAILSIALSLSIGTMIGWRRIAITIGENIGTKNINYIQWLSAQITAAMSIYLASYTGMPVSTTHVVSSAITGTILVNGENIQKKTIKNILITWILTLPISIVLSSSLFWIALKFL